MKGKKCDNCGCFTLFLMLGFMRCSECGLSICNEWGDRCPFNLRVKDQEKCLECYRIRLSPRKRTVDGSADYYARAHTVSPNHKIGAGVPEPDSRGMIATTVIPKAMTVSQPHPRELTRPHGGVYDKT